MAGMGVFRDMEFKDSDEIIPPEVKSQLQFMARDGTYVTVYGNRKAILELSAILADRDMAANRRSAQIDDKSTGISQE